MIPLTEKEMKQMKGGIITATALLGYVAVAAGVAAIVKIITSSRGKISIPGINIQWGN